MVYNLVSFSASIFSHMTSEVTNALFARPNHVQKAGSIAILIIRTRKKKFPCGEQGKE